MIRALGYYSCGIRDPDVMEWEKARLDPDAAQSFLDLVERARAASDTDFVWLGLHDPDPAELDLLADKLELGALRVEDALSPRQRAKVEYENGSVFAVFKVLTYNDATSLVETGQVAVFIGPGFLLSVRLGDLGDLGPLRMHLEERGSKVLRSGPLGVLYSIADTVVDGYADVAEEISIDIAQIEESVFSSTDEEDQTEQAYLLKRENLEMRRAIDPLIPMATTLIRGDSPLVPPDLLPYYRDLSDHLLRTSDLITTHDTLLSSVLEAIRARVAIRQNDDMRKISAWVAIAAVPTAIAGIYGMNFDNMPELRLEYGYYVVVGVMISVCTFLYIKFKRSGWL